MVFGDMFIVDFFVCFFKVLVLIGFFVVILMFVVFNECEKMNCFEFLILIVFVVFGMCMMFLVNSLIVFYMGLEL